MLYYSFIVPLKRTMRRENNSCYIEFEEDDQWKSLLEENHL